MNPPSVLLLSPGVIRWSDQDFGLPHLVAMGTVLQKELGLKVHILDLGYEGSDHRALAQTLESLGPFLFIGLSTYSSFDYRRCLSVGRFLKQLYPDTVLVTGGYHASALPEDLDFEGSPFDVVVQGEGELPILKVAKAILGGERPQRRYPTELVQELDELPLMDWSLLDRYWPRAHSLGRKLQITLSRGCPYHCTFCMERAKTGYQWRAFSPTRAVDELKNLARHTDLGAWVVNIADPLFGFVRRWRKEVLEGILQAGLVPRQFWTLTRSDDLDEDDVQLLAKARFSIGIGLESGSPTMLKIMQKGNHPEAYLGAILRLAERSRRFGLNWAANIIVGHPGETPETMWETRNFLEALYLSAPETCGWLSVDPFRLYPGAQVHQQMAEWEQRYGSRFYHKEWWKSWYDGPFQAQHIDPSRELSYEDRVRFYHDAYGPLMAEVQQRFRGQGRNIDRVFERSLAEQRANLDAAQRDKMIALGSRIQTGGSLLEPGRPLGLQVRDPRVRRREQAVARMLESGLLRTEAVLEALLEVEPSAFMPESAAEALLADRLVPVPEGEAPWAVGLSMLVRVLEELALGPGERAADLLARSGYVAALFAELVGRNGEVLALVPGSEVEDLAESLRAWPQVRVEGRQPEQPWSISGRFDGLYLGAALPKLQAVFRRALRAEGRGCFFVGPRFRSQDLLCVTAEGERRLGRGMVGVLGGAGGWVPARSSSGMAPRLSFSYWPGVAAGFRVFSGVDLGLDAATQFEAGQPVPPWAAELAEAWNLAPGRLSLVAEILRHREVGSLRAALESPPAPLRDGAGQALVRVFLGGLTETEESLPELPGQLARDLEQLRGLLYRDRQPPPLRVLHAPALGRRGRAMQVGEERRVAVSLLEKREHIVMQVLHEEVHPLTDPLVEGPQGDTRKDSEGWSLHQEREQLAVAATEAFLLQKAPGWIGPFRAWVEQIG